MSSVISKVNINDLKGEVKLLRSFVIGMAGRDKEGDYKPSFVKRILHLARTEAPTYHFADQANFLKHLAGHSKR